jgi:hypothetical protein
MENKRRSSVEIEQFEKWRDDFKSEGVHSCCGCSCHVCEGEHKGGFHTAECSERFWAEAERYHELTADHWGKAACTEQDPCTFCKCVCHSKPSLKAYQALCACASR